MTSSTQYFDDTTFNKFSRSASRFASAVEPVNRAIGSAMNLAGGTIGLASLGYKAITSPFDLIEHGQRISAVNSLKALNKLGSAFRQDPYDFSEQQYETAKQHLGNVGSFVKSYGAPDRDTTFRSSATSPQEINRIRSDLDEYTSNFGEDYAKARQRMVNLYDAEARSQVLSGNNASLASISEDSDILSNFDVPINSTKGAQYFASYLPTSGIANLNIQDKQTVAEIQKNVDIYELNKNNNTPKSIELCRQAMTKASRLSKEINFPQSMRAKLLQLKYDYAIRSRRWKT